MEKKHLGYSDRLLVRVLKSQEHKLKSHNKPVTDEEKAELEAQVEFYHECLTEAERRGLVKVVKPTPVQSEKKEEKKQEEKKD